MTLRSSQKGRPEIEEFEVSIQYFCADLYDIVKYVALDTTAFQVSAYHGIGNSREHLIQEVLGFRGNQKPVSERVPNKLPLLVKISSRSGYACYFGLELLVKPAAIQWIYRWSVNSFVARTPR